MKTSYFLLCVLITVNVAAYAQTENITNIQVSQRQDNSGLVDVYFDLSGSEEEEYFVSMLVSFDGGDSYNFVGTNFISGDVDNVNSGTNKHIIWDGGQNYPDTYSTNSKLKILVSDFDCGGTLTDNRDGQTYATIPIGNQCWMAENLNYETGNSWWYDNDPDNGDTYGRLYTWYSAMDACPDGWHLPSDEEWKILEMALGMSQSEADDTGWRGTDQGEQMKSTSGWLYNGNGTNSSGFNASPSGYRSSYYEQFDSLGIRCGWWSSTDGSSTSAWRRRLDSDRGQVSRQNKYKTGCRSIRCLKD